MPPLAGTLEQDADVAASLLAHDHGQVGESPDHEVSTVRLLVLDGRSPDDVADELKECAA